MPLRQSSRKAIFCLSARLARASFLANAMGEPLRIESSDDDEESSDMVVSWFVSISSSSVAYF